MIDYSYLAMYGANCQLRWLYATSRKMQNKKHGLGSFRYFARESFLLTGWHVDIGSDILKNNFIKDDVKKENYGWDKLSSSFGQKPDFSNSTEWGVKLALVYTRFVEQNT